MKILAITGIKSEYDILYPVLLELKKQKFKIKLVVSGAHLTRSQNYTYKKILLDKFNIVKKIYSLSSSDQDIQRPKAISILINGLTQIVEKINPDFIFVIGDREEAIAGAIVGNYMKKLVIHLGGGETAYGNADDPIRFAISKLSHLHCCISKFSCKKLIESGEEKFRIFNTGNPAFINIKNTPRITKEKLFDKIGMDNIYKKYIVLIKHPLSSEKDKLFYQLKVTTESLKIFCLKNNLATICLQPNSDPGFVTIDNYFKNYDKHNKWFFYHKTLNRIQFINLIRNAKVLVGNSSMGFLEAPFYSLPVVNIGNRQKGRNNAGNVIFTKYNQKEIIKAIEKCYFNKEFLSKIHNIKNIYGNISSAKKIVKAIKSVDLNNNKWLIKKLT